MPENHKRSITFEQLKIKLEIAIGKADLQYGPPYTGSIVKQSMVEAAAVVVMDLVAEGELHA